MNQLQQLKSILQKEIQDIEGDLMKNHIHEGEITERLYSRLANHNNITRINTLKWVLEVITTLEA